MWVILSIPQAVLHLLQNLPAEWNCSCISKCFYSIMHIKELSVIVKMSKKKGNETILALRKQHFLSNTEQLANSCST